MDQIAAFLKNHPDWAIRFELDKEENSLVIQVWEPASLEPKLCVQYIHMDAINENYHRDWMACTLEIAEQKMERLK